MSQHTASSRFEPSSPRESKNRSSVSPGAPFPRPHQPSLLQVVDDRHVDVATLPGDLVHADVGQSGEVLALPSPGHRRLHGLLHRRPRAAEQAGHMRPRQQLRPLRHRHRHGPGEPLLPLRPGHCLHAHPAPLAAHPPKSVDQRDRDAPERHVPVAPLPSPVSVPSLPAALPAPWGVPPVRGRSAPRSPPYHPPPRPPETPSVPACP